MSKYGIFEVRYEETEEGNKHISEVKAYLFTDENKINNSNEKIFTRADVALTIEYNLNEFVTIYKDDDRWRLGAKVIIEEIDGKKFIKTVANGKKEDNLGNLPEY